MGRQFWWVATVAMLAGCASVPAPEPVATPRVDELPRLRERARVVLANYAKAVGNARLVVVWGHESKVAGALEPRNEQLKPAIDAGRLEAAGELPAAPRAKGEAVWSGGRRLSLPLLPARAALRLLAVKDDCPQCVRHPVTGARLTTMRVLTTRGPATVPAWEFSLKDTRVRVLRMALDNGGPREIDPPAGDPGDVPEGVVAESARVDGRRLTLAVHGHGHAGRAAERASCSGSAAGAACPAPIGRSRRTGPSRG